MKIKLLEGASMPKYATPGAAGFDLKAHSFKKLYNIGNVEQPIDEHVVAGTDLVLAPFERALIGTGIHVELPKGLEMQIRPRSGNALKKGLMISNSPGTIDSDYRGEVGVIVYNSTGASMTISLGDAIAQGVVTSYVTVQPIQVEELDETQRGEGGFGSTDTKKA